MTEQESLWNIPTKKYKKVIEYVDSIKPREEWKEKTLRYFNKKIKEAHEEPNSNDILKIIGYKFNKSPQLLEDCWEIDLKEKKKEK